MGDVSRVWEGDKQSDEVAAILIGVVYASVIRPARHTPFVRFVGSLREDDAAACVCPQRAVGELGAAAAHWSGC